MNEQELLQQAAQNEKTLHEAVGRLYSQLLMANTQMQALATQNSQLQSQLTQTQELLNKQQIASADSVRAGGTNIPIVGQHRTEPVLDAAGNQIKTLPSLNE